MPFTFVSVDLSELTTTAADVTFVGTLDGGGSVEQTFTLDGNEFQPETFALVGFENVVQVDWTQVVPLHQFDNLVVSVPEPGTLLMSLAAAGLHRRVIRRRPL